MPYIIKDFNSSNVRLVIPDGTVDNSTSLNLVGKNVSNFGALQNENFLYLLENFAGSTSPSTPVNGQLWYDQANLNYYNQGIWSPLAVLTTDGSTNQLGALYLNQTSNQLYINTGSRWSLVGPEGVPGRGTTRMFSTVVQDLTANTHPVIKIIVDEETVGIISTASFFVNSTNSIAGFPYVNRGITLKNYATNDFTVYGRSVFSNLSTTATNVAGGASGSLVYQSNTSTTTYLGIGANGTILTSNGSTPQWQSITNIEVELAINLASGIKGSLPYQTNPDNTAFLPLGNQGYLLTAGINGPVWSNPNIISVTSSTNSIHSNVSDYATTATYAANAFHSFQTDSILWTGIRNTPTTTDGYGIVNAITNSNIHDQSVLQAEKVHNQIGLDNSTYGTVYGQWTLDAGATFYATYADLAEKYLPDEDYGPGTVLSFGGINEVTLSASAMDTAVAGIVSTNPAYALNQALVGGVYIALAGRVPCKVIGPIKKGDLLVTSKIPGVATAASNVSFFGPKTGAVLGKATEGYEQDAIVGVIEVMVKSA